MKKNPVIVVLATAAALGAIFFIVLYLSSLLIGGKSSKTIRPLPGGDRVALIKVEGVLIASERIVDEINDYAEDSSVKAIVLRIDSPGGGVVASQEIYNALMNAKREGKKIVASMGSVAASGGYYIAAAADKIVANPGTLTGSIGVKMEYPNLEKLLEKIGVKEIVVKSGEYKDVGSPFRNISERERKLLQGVIDDVQSQFVEAVATGRSLSIAEVRAIADGRIFTGRQALELKLVDQMGDLAVSIQLAGDLAGIKGKPRVTGREKKLQFFDYFKEETASWVAGVIKESFGKSQVQLQYLYRQ
ncbi:MAG TPA: signal peptide peptidase SppA [Nitrospirota bacterium]|nr:signal peptide peptidase SppA [Nitrospirota bacterium]